MKKLVAWDNSFHMQKMLKRRWFWVGVVALILVAFYLAGYLKWYAEGAKYRIQNQISNQYIASQEAQQAALEAQYKNDPYGGATPEETLSLFVAALKAGNLENASNYYLPDQKDRGLGELKVSSQRGYLENYIEVLDQRSRGYAFSDGKTYEIKFFDASGSQNHIERFQLNPFTNKWLISDL